MYSKAMLPNISSILLSHLALCVKACSTWTGQTCVWMAFSQSKID
uniref:Uncharacterized protein n=1 Tax=Anguilla anguilla TaxID=7936 RepID=A0A0E9XYN1_ANGAN